MTLQREADDLAGWSSTLERTRAGSVEAFEDVYTFLSPMVAGYLRMSGVHDVESVTNEVFLQVHQGLHRFSGDWPAFRAWVFTIAHHRMVDETRRALRRPRTVSMESVDVGPPVGDAEVDALASLADERLARVLAELSVDQRGVLLLRIVADLPLEEVALSLGKTVGAVKSLQHRALATLRRSLEREEADT